jgi:hypothetical protein
MAADYLAVLAEPVGLQRGSLRSGFAQKRQPFGCTTGSHQAGKIPLQKSREEIFKNLFPDYLRGELTDCRRERALPANAASDESGASKLQH